MGNYLSNYTPIYNFQLWTQRKSDYEQMCITVARAEAAGEQLLNVTSAV